MNKQRKVLITTTYNEMGIIIDTKAEEVAQQTCSQLATDIISRQAVLDLIADYDLSMGQVVNGIHTLPPVTPQPKTKWIPVSERLPEDTGYYLTTTKYGEVYCDYWTGISFDRSETVIAWMPLPAPYEPQESEE